MVNCSKGIIGIYVVQFVMTGLACYYVIKKEPQVIIQEKEVESSQVVSSTNGVPRFRSKTTRNALQVVKVTDYWCGRVQSGLRVCMDGISYGVGDYSHRGLIVAALPDGALIKNMLGEHFRVVKGADVQPEIKEKTSLFGTKNKVISKKDLPEFF